MSEELTARDWERIELYLKAGSKPWKIAKIFHMSNGDFKTALESRYKKSWERIVEGFEHSGEVLIEATQFQKALSGNITMLIWLGKVRCGQKEPESNSSIPAIQEEIDREHIIMQLKHQNAQLLSQMSEMKEVLGKNGITFDI